MGLNELPGILVLFLNPVVMKSHRVALILPLLFFTACQEDQSASTQVDSELSAVYAMEARLARLESDLLQEKNARLQRENQQNEMLAEIKELITARNASRADLPPQVHLPAVKLEVTPLKIDGEGGGEAPGESGEKEERMRLQKIRTEAQGEAYRSLKTLSGEEYQDLVITQVNDIGVVFRHRTGVARIPFTELPRDWGERFGYDPGRAREAVRREQEVQIRRDQAIAQEMAEERERAEQQAVEARLAQLAQAVENLRREEGTRPSQAWIANGFWGGVPLVTNGPFSFWNRWFCPPVVHPPVVSPPVVRNHSSTGHGGIRNHGSSLGSVPRLEVPTLRRPARSPSPTTPGSVVRPVVATPTVQRPASRDSGGSPAVSRPRVIRSTPSTPTNPVPRVVRPASSGRTSTRIQRSSSSGQAPTRSSGGVIRRTR